MAEAEAKELADPNCPKCEGKGTRLIEFSHEAELWYCTCTGKWGEVRG